MVSMSSEGVVDVGVDAEAAVGFPSLAALPHDQSRVRTVGFLAAQVEPRSVSPCPHLLFIVLRDRGPPAMLLG
jgi:hypothetical protein